jgi:hypothetical protein
MQAVRHILIYGRWHSNVPYVRYFRGADCDTSHYLVIAKGRERLAVNKQETQKFDTERFSLKNLNETELQTGSQLWRTSMMMWISIEHRRILERISK